MWSLQGGMLEGTSDNPYLHSPKLNMGSWKEVTTWNPKCPIVLGNFTPKTSNYCLKNRALGFPGTNLQKEKQKVPSHKSSNDIHLIFFSGRAVKLGGVFRHSWNCLKQGGTWKTKPTGNRMNHFFFLMTWYQKQPFLWMKPHFVLGMVETLNIHLKLVVLFGLHGEVWFVLEVCQPTLKNVLNSPWMFVRRKIIGQKLLCWRRNLEFGGGFLRLDFGGFYPGNFQAFYSIGILFCRISECINSRSKKWVIDRVNYHDLQPFSYKNPSGN